MAVLLVPDMMPSKVSVTERIIFSCWYSSH